MRTILYVTSIASIAIAAFYMLLPLTTAHLSYLLHPYPLNSLDDARNYYHTISSIATTIAALLSVTLGIFYYFNKLDIESTRIRIQAAKSRLQEINESLSKIDEYCSQIYSDALGTLNDLKYARARMTYHFDKIISFISIDDSLIDWNTAPESPFLFFYSFVDNSDTLSHSLQVISTVQKQEVDAYHERYRMLTVYLQQKFIEIEQLASKQNTK